MKRIWNALYRQLKNFRYQKRAVKYAEKIQLGQITNAAPIHRSERKYYDEIQKDERIKKELTTKDENLVVNMNKFNINTDEIVEYYPTKRPLPTRESEWQHRNDAEWEYGYYEPPSEKIPKGKLLLREALEILHLRQELFGDRRITQKRAEELEEKLNAHPASVRVPQEHLDRIWQYFRPFERHDTQDVVSIAELEQLDELLSKKDEVDIIGDIESGIGRLLQRDNSAKDARIQLEEDERRRFLKESMLIRFKEAKRLKESLKQVELPKTTKDEDEAEDKSDKPRYQDAEPKHVGEGIAKEQEKKRRKEN